MKYFQILNCKKEPFPGQASPKHFFAAGPHKQCLDTILTSVHSGHHPLEVVIGEEGTGKTTLYYQAKAILSTSETTFCLETTSPNWFSSKIIFLGKLAAALKLKSADHPDEPLLINEIKAAIAKPLQQDDKKTVLLIDQAEHIPSYCLEVLEELFTEQNDQTTMQMVLFARPIFTDKISLYSHLSQKSNIINLSPKLGFSDANALLTYYLQESGSDLTLPILTSTAGQWSLHCLSKGNPGKLLDLFRLALLNQICQNRSKIGLLLVQQSAKEIFPERVKRFERVKVTTLAVLCLIVVVTILVVKLPVRQSDFSQTPSLQEKSKNSAEHIIQDTPPKDQYQEQAKGTQAAENSLEESNQKHVVDILKSLQDEGAHEKQTDSIGSSTAKTRPPTVIHETSGKPARIALPTKLPLVLGTITVFEQETLGDMIRRIYGPYSFTPDNTNKVLAQNKQIHSKHLLSVGAQITFPNMTVKIAKNKVKNHWIHLNTIDTLQDAYRYLRIYGKQNFPLLMLPSWSSQNTYQFEIIMEESFASQQAAEGKLAQLSTEIFPTASILEGLEPTWFYYTAKKPHTRKANLVLSPTKVKMAKVNQLPILTSSSKKSVKSSPAAPSSTSMNSSGEKNGDHIREIAPDQEKSRTLLGELRMPKDTTLGHMIRSVYGKNSVNRTNISLLLERNHHIKDPNNIVPGTTVRFPRKDIRIPKNSAAAWWLGMATFDTLQDAYSFLFANTHGKPWLLILPSVQQDALEFIVVAEQFFQTELQAGEKKEALKKKGFHDITIIHGLQDSKYSFQERK